MINFLIPVFSAVSQAGSHTLDKIILSTRKTTFKTYLGISFPLFALINIVLFAILKPSFGVENFLGIAWILVLITTGISIVTNLTFYKALHDDSLGEIETLYLLRNIPIIIFSSIIFSDERNFFVILIALFASLAVLWSHFEHHHFKIAKNSLHYLVWTLVSAPLDAIILKIILQTWDPMALLLVRSIIMGMVFGFLFFKDAKNSRGKTIAMQILTNIFTSIGWLLYYLSYQKTGIVFTTLIVTLQPLLTYLASLLFLKEKFHWKKTMAFAMILLSLVPAQIIK